MAFALLQDRLGDRVKRADQDIGAAENVVDAERRVSRELLGRSPRGTAQDDLLHDRVQLEAREAVSGRLLRWGA